MATRKCSRFDVIPSDCKFKDGEQVPQNGLAITPGMVKAMSDQGIPVSLSFSGMIDESTETFDVDPVFRRGADINTAWESENTAKKKVMKANRNDVRRYGNSSPSASNS